MVVVCYTKSKKKCPIKFPTKFNMANYSYDGPVCEMPCNSNCIECYECQQWTVFSSHSRWFEIQLTYTPVINPTSIMNFTISTVKLNIPYYPFTRITRNSKVFLHVNFCEFLSIPVYSCKFEGVLFRICKISYNRISGYYRIFRFISKIIAYLCAFLCILVNLIIFL